MLRAVDDLEDVMPIAPIGPMIATITRDRDGRADLTSDRCGSASDRRGVCAISRRSALRDRGNSVSFGPLIGAIGAIGAIDRRALVKWMDVDSSGGSEACV